MYHFELEYAANLVFFTFFSRKKQTKTCLKKKKKHLGVFRS